MKIEKKKRNQFKANKAPFDSASLLFSIVAILLISIGIYLNLKSESAVGISQPGKYGQGGSMAINIPALFVIGLGIFFAAFPTVDLIRILRKRQ